MIDVHAHVYELPNYREIEARMRELGIKAINCGLNRETNLKVLAMKSDILLPALGLWPVDALQCDYKKELKFIESHAKEIVCIGEVGLDYYWIKEEAKRAKEREVFVEIVWLANELKLPLNVHSRRAEKHTLEILEKHANVPVILHAFGGNDKEISRGIENNFFFSIPPIVKRSKHFKHLVELVPVNQLLLESDTPYLGLCFPNDPIQILVSLEEIARIKGLEIEEARKRIEKNTEFSLKKK